MSIQEFFRGRNVLVTGGTGFMGKVLIEKLLRSCPGIGKICLLIRQKQGKDTNSRIKEIFGVQVKFYLCYNIILYLYITSIRILYAYILITFLLNYNRN